MRQIVLILGLAALLGGCSGQYVLTVPDVVAPAGGLAPVALRLERKEFWRFNTPCSDAAMLVRVGQEPIRAAYTGNQGYAAVAVPVPEAPGVYTLTVTHQDSDRGDEVRQVGTVYAFAPQRLTLAVAWEALDQGAARGESLPAAEALGRLAQAGVQVVYLSGDKAARPGEAHSWLVQNGLPDGPVLSWAWQRDWLFRRVQVTGSLPAARQQLPALVIGVGESADEAERFNALGIVAVDMGGEKAPQGVRVGSWAELAERIAGSDLVKTQDFKALSAEQVRAALGR